MAGLGEVCTAILFYLEAAVRIRGQPTSTQKECEWVMPAFQKKILYLQVKDIDFSSPISKKKELDNSSSSPQPPRSCQYQLKLTRPSSTELQSFFKNLTQCDTKTAVLSVVPQYAEQYIQKSRSSEYPTTLTSLYDSKYLSYSYTKLLNVCDTVNITVNRNMAAAVQKETVKQAASKSWFKIRAARVTASRMKQACRTDPAMPSQSLVKAICYPDVYQFSTKGTRWGCEHEIQARTKYEAIQSRSHTKLSVEESGLILHPSWPHLGASPDGIVKCHCCGKGVIEIKCPLCNSDKAVEETVANGNSCLKTAEAGSVHLNKNHAYCYQVQIFICEVKYCNFCVCMYFPQNWTQHTY